MIKTTYKTVMIKITKSSYELKRELIESGAKFEAKQEIVNGKPSKSFWITAPSGETCVVHGESCEVISNDEISVGSPIFYYTSKQGAIGAIVLKIGTSKIKIEATIEGSQKELWVSPTSCELQSKYKLPAQS